MKDEFDIRDIWKVGNSYSFTFTLVDFEEFSEFVGSMYSDKVFMGMKLDSVSLQDELSLQDMLNKNNEKLTQIMEIINETGEET